MQFLIEKLHLSTAAKTWLAFVAVGAQVALSYIPAHDNMWYNITQALVGGLSLIGVYAVPNKVAAVKSAIDGGIGAVTTVVTPAVVDQSEPVKTPIPPVA